MKAEAAAYLLLLLAPAQAKEDPKPFSPRIAESRLVVKGSKLAPMAIRSPPIRTVRAGDRCFVVSGSEVSEVRPNDPAVRLWTARNKAANELRWIASGGGVAFLLPLPVPKPNVFDDYRFSEMLRLDLNSHSWLTPLRLEGDAAERLNKNQQVVFGDLIANDHTVILLTHVAEAEEERLGLAIHTYRVTCFKKNGELQQWSQSFPSRGSVSSQSRLLYRTATPDPAEYDSTPLTFFRGDSILVCAGWKEDLILLDAANGGVRWRQECVWEYERGFTGPSVWNHHIARLGWTGWDADDEEEEGKPKPPPKSERLKAARKQYDERYEGFIVSGPIVVRAREFDRETTRIFVACAVGRKGVWSGMTANCAVIEFDDSGTPRGMSTLPRMVAGGFVKPLDDAIVWACVRNGVIRLTGAPPIEHARDAPQTEDRLLPINWYRELGLAPRKASLVTAAPRHVLAFGRMHLFNVVEGAYEARRGEHVLRMPIAAVDLNTGEATDLELVVPFDGHLGKPTSNYGNWDGQIRTHEPFKLWIKALETDGGTLKITIETEKTATQMEFDISKAIEPGEKSW